MGLDWAELQPDIQVALAREALDRARHLVGAQAMLLAEHMEHGAVEALDGPGALRLLAMLLAEERARPASDGRRAVSYSH